MAKQLTCLLVIVLGLVFVWADETNSNNATVVLPSSNTSAGVVPPLDLNNNSSIPKTDSIPAQAAGTDVVVPQLVCNSLDENLNCTVCVLNNCTYVMETDRGICTNDTGSYDEFTLWISHTAKDCVADDTTTTTTTVAPTTQNTTTTVAPNTTTTTTTTTTPPTTTIPTTLNTTTTAAPNTTTTAATTTTAVPTNVTTTATPTTPTTEAPQPKSGGWGWGSFFAGIVFTASVTAVAYVVWRFYKARTERNYHTL